MLKLQNDPLTKGWRGQAIFFIIILMMGSLFFSRALLSISTAALVIICCIHKDYKIHLSRFLATPLLWGITLLFFLPFISGLWSEDTISWMKVIRVKLPLLLLPLAFAGPWQLSSRQWKWIAGLFLGMVTAGTLWSCSQYLADSEAIHAAYLKAKTIPVPLGGDYIRFSWLVCTAVILAVMLLVGASDKSSRILLLLLAAWLIIYLHLLAARTGLFACYLFLFSFFIYQLFRLRQKIIALLVLVAVLILPVIAWLFFPTFQNRFKYLRYDFDFVKNSQYLAGATDGNRLFSIKAGWDIVKENPFGVGAGDLRKVTVDWYNKEVPGMVEMDKIYPSNEWLIYGGFTGWVGIVVFSFVMLLPFLYKSRHKLFYWYCFHGTAIFSFIVDTGLEVQFGVFLYSFITCCWWKWLQRR